MLDKLLAQTLGWEPYPAYVCNLAESLTFATPLTQILGEEPLVQPNKNCLLRKHTYVPT